jgi:hypothetical protein
MSNDHVHPIFQECLAPFAPPDDGGLQHAQTTEPEPKDAIEHLEIGGYKREAELLREARYLLLALTGIASDPDAYPSDMTRAAIAQGESLIDKISRRQLPAPRRRETMPT